MKKLYKEQQRIDFEKINMVNMSENLTKDVRILQT